MYDREMYKKGLRNGIIITSLVAIFVIGCISLIYLNSSKSAAILGADPVKVRFIQSVIDKYYYNEVDDEARAEGIYKGMIAGLDDEYAEYFTAEEYKKLKETTSGSFSGVGMVLSREEDGRIIVQSVYEGSPAEKAGMKAEDILVAAGDVKASECETVSDFAMAVRGEIGSELKLTYIRDGEEQTVTMVRENIDIKSVEYEMMDDGIGYLYITDFSENTFEQFKAAMEDLESQGMKGVIFDLRYNGGGTMDAAVDMLDYLLPEGLITYIEDKNGNKQEFKSDAEHYVDMPMVVLTTENTASASEIFTAALRDYDCATIVGTKTYGKGVVQSLVELKDGSAVKVTSAKYFTPKGENIDKVGIEPDIKLEYEYLGDDNQDYDEAYDNQIQKGIEVLREEINK
ncbi:MAG: S41 family peptidase [Lachnospiraceae bacterium]|nr:S41 family peptidase [Lachnospiraceae bacterium]